MPVFEQHFAYYQVRDVEGTVIDTRAGDDTVHADPEFSFPNVDSEWGIDLGDFEQGGRIAALEIRGGPGADRLFGGVLADTIDGGAGADVILGGPGDDHITGGGGADLLFGNGGISPDVLEVVRRGGETAPNDEFQFAAGLPSLTAPAPRPPSASASRSHCSRSCPAPSRRASRTWCLASTSGIGRLVRDRDARAHCRASARPMPRRCCPR